MHLTRKEITSEVGKTPPTILEVVNRLQAILKGTISREEVADWAGFWVMADEPDIEDALLWKLIKQAAGVDLKDSPVSYLHDEADIRSWIEPFMCKDSEVNIDREDDEQSKKLSNNPQFLAIIQQAREEKGKGGLSTEEMKQWMETELSQES